MQPSTSRLWKRTVLAAAVWSFSLLAAPAATLVWTNTAGGLWSTAANWLPNAVPGAGDTAIITNAATYTVTLDGAVTVNTLVLGAPSGGTLQTLACGGFTLNITGTGTVNPRGYLLLEGGTVTIAAAGGVTLAGRFDWNGGVVGSGPLTIAAGGVLVYSDAPGKGLTGPLTNAGTIFANFGTLVIQNDGATTHGKVVNLAGGVFDFNNDSGGVSADGAQASFINAGLVRKSGGTGNSRLDARFINTGSVEVQTGAISLAAGGTLGGSYTTAAGTTLNFDGGNWDVAGTPVFGGAGSSALAAGTLTLTSTAIPNLALTGGTLVLAPGFQGGTITNLTIEGMSLAGTNVVTGTFNWNGGNVGPGPLTVAAGGVLVLSGAPGKSLTGPLTNAGTIFANFGTFQLVNDGATTRGRVVNLAGGVFDFVNNSLSIDGDPLASFANAGTVRKSGGTGNSPVNVRFINTGTVEVLTGQISFGGALTQLTGTLNFGISNATAFGTIGISGAVTLGGTFGGTLLGGFIPATNNVFVVMTFGSSSGAFSDLAGQDLGFYRYFRKLVDATSATLETRRAPIAVDDPITINEDIISDLVVLANDNDAYGLTIRLAGVTAPAHGTATTNVNGTIHYVPDTNYFGSDTFTYLINNGDGGSSTGRVNLTIQSVNDAPTVTFATNNVVVLEDSGAKTVTTFATFSPGPANESAETLLGYTLSNSSNALFSAQPAIDNTGRLAFTPATNANGAATVTVVVQDNGGTANGGVDKSTNTFTITVTPVNDPPSVAFTTNNVVVLEDSGANAVAAFATFSPGPANESAQTLLGYTLSNSSNALFSVQPAIDNTGRLTFTTATNANGSATVTVVVQDNGGVLNGGVDKSTNTFTITVTPVNDPPTVAFTTNNVVALEDSGANAITAFATFLSGPANESAQTLLGYTLSNSSNALFSVQPAIDNTGRLTFTPATNANGSATVTVIAQDSGGIANGGVDKSTNTFTLTVSPVNDAPTVAFITSNVGVPEGSGASAITAFATFSPGPSNEAAQTLLGYTLSNNSNALFAVQPALDNTGRLTFTLATNANANASATVTVIAQDSGGTANGGVDKSTNSFTITVTPANLPTNSPPTTTFATNAVVVLEDSGANTLNAFATFSPGPANESAQSLLGYTLSNSSNALFSAQPALDNTGRLTFTPAANANGSAIVTVIAQDNGGTANGGVDKSTNTFTITVTPVNDAPVVAFTTNNVVVLEDSGANGLAAFATFSPGPANESAQTLVGYTLSNSSNALFAVQPALDNTGRLTFTTATNANGSATVTVIAQDSGGTANGGVDKSTNTFTITVTPVNDAPAVAFSTNNVVVLDDSGANTLNAFATFSPGPANESAQTLVGYTLSNSSNALFAVQPALDNTGRLTFTPATNANGSATIIVIAQDNGGTANGGVDKCTNIFTITLSPVNDAPIVTFATNSVVVPINSGAWTLTPFATFSPGPANEAAQTLLGYSLANNNPALFSIPPAISLTGTLTFTPATNANGSATVTVIAQDNGGTLNGGVDKCTNTFTLTVTPASIVTNSPPTFTLPATVPAGGTWTARESSRAWQSVASSTDGTKLVAIDGGFHGQFYASDDSGETWTPRRDSEAWVSVASSADGMKLAAVQPRYRHHLSDNSGVSWLLGGFAGVSELQWTQIASSRDGMRLAAVTRGAGLGGNIYTSSTTLSGGGGRDLVIRLGPGNRIWRSIASSADGMKLAAADFGFTTSGGQIYTSTDYGVTWAARATNRQWRAITSSADGTKLVAAVADGQIYTSSDSGMTWIPRDSNRNWSALASSDDGLMLAAAVSSGLIFLSANSGETWTPQVDAGARNWTSIASSAAGRQLVAAAYNGQLYTLALGFTLPSVAVLEDSGAFSTNNFVTNISPGPAADAGQAVNFLVTNNSNSLFSAQPAISPVGTLTFTPATNAYGLATVTVVAHDNGGTASGGVDTSAPQTFDILIRPVNDPPTVNFTTNNVVVSEANVVREITPFATFSPGPPNEAAQALVGYTLSNDNPALFMFPPALAAGGMLTFAPAPRVNGVATVTVIAQDSGGTRNGGADMRTNTFTITVSPANDAPSFTLFPTLFGPAGEAWTAEGSSGYWVGIAMSADGTRLAAVPSRESSFSTRAVIHTSADSGATWTPQAGSGSRNWRTVASSADGMKLVAAVYGGQLYTSTNFGETWTPRESERAWLFLASSADGTKLAAVEVGSVFAPDRGLIRTSTDSGLTWTPRESSRAWRAIASSADGVKLAAVAAGDQIFTSIDSGATWTARDSSRGWLAIASSADGTRLVAAADNDLIYTSTNSGATWTPQAGAGSRAWRSVATSADGTRLAAAVFDGQIYTSTDGGVIWTARDSNRFWQSIASSADGTRLAAAVERGTDPLIPDPPGLIYRSSGVAVPLTVTADSGPYAQSNLARNISPGPADEAGQLVNFLVTNNSNALFSVQPAIAPNGTLTFTPAPSGRGTATVTVRAHDNGGTANGGHDTSEPQTFTITVTGGVAPTNRPPTTTFATNAVVVLEDSGAQTLAAFATFSPGPPSDSAQSITNVVTSNSNPALFSVPPTLALNGTLTFTPATNANGSATVTVIAQDNGGTANGGVDKATNSFTLTVTAVNDAPAFVHGPNLNVSSAAGTQTVPAWATAISAGPANESGQLLNFLVANSSNALFSAQPAVAPNGTLTFTPAPGADGIATVTVQLHDNGGTLNGGVDTSAPQTFTITVGPRPGRRLWAMGDNRFGQLGDGTTLPAAPFGRPSPVPVAGDVIAAAAGGDAVVGHSLFVKRDGSLFAVGNNSSGQLGDGTTTNRTVPVRVATNVADVVAGERHSLFLKRDGTLWAMGANGSGRLGDGTLNTRSNPVQVATSVATASAGALHSLFVKRDATLWAMGGNAAGQLGDGTVTTRLAPVLIAANVRAAAAGEAHSLFLKNDGTLWAMGRNVEGQLGDHTNLQRNSPVAVTNGVVAFAAGSAHSFFLRTNGTLWAMGYNFRGQLGDGTTNQHNFPVLVATNALTVAAGADHSLFVKRDGSLWAMGWNAFGQLGDGTFLDRRLPVLVAAAATLAPAPAAPAVPVGLLNPGVTAVAGSGSHSLFLADAPAPEVICPTNLVVGNDAGKCSAKVLFAPTVRNGAGTTLVCIPPSGSIFPAGTNVVTCTLFAGLPAAPVAACSFTVTVVDRELPRFLTRPADRRLLPTDRTDPDATGRPTATDNCTAAPRIAYTEVITPGTAPIISVIKRTWTATDAAGNAAAFVQTLTVVPSLAIGIQCPTNVIVQCGAPTTPDKTGFATATNSASCGPAVITFADTIGTGTAPVVKVITRTWTALDPCGNRATCVQKITVVDTTAPTILTFTATPATVTPPNNLFVPVTLQRVVADTCYPGTRLTATLTVRVTDPAGLDGGTYYVIKSLGLVNLRAKRGVTYTLTLTVRDPSGNVATKAITVPVR